MNVPASLPIAPQPVHPGPSPSSTRSSLQRWFSLLPTVAGGLVIFAGLLALAGWWTNIITPRNLLSLKPDVAIALGLAGCSLWLMAPPTLGGRHVLGQIIAGCVAFIGFSVWLNYATRWHVCIHELFRFLPPGRSPIPDRMPLATGLGTFLTGCALLLLERKTPRGHRPAHFITVALFIVSAIALIGYLYEVSSLYYLGDYQYLAFYTPLLFFLLGAGILAARPDSPPMKIITGPGVGSVMLRGLLPPVITLLVVLSWVRLMGQRAGLFDSETGTALGVVAHILIFAALVFATAYSLNRADLHRRQLEQNLQHRTELLEAANKELEAFAYTVSHDLRAPLRAINGLSLAVLEDSAEKLDEPSKHSLQRVRAATDRMNQLIDGLLQLSRTARVHMSHETIDLSSMAEQLASELRQRDPHRNVEVIIAENLSARGDPVLLRTVLQNLLENAWKFTANTPHARIEFGCIEGQSSPIFLVRDNGVGFDMAYANKLFTPFQRLHSRHEFSGHGIGLATVQRVILRHGGRIWGQSQPYQETTFFFTLTAQAAAG